MSATGDPEQIEREIEQTREELGDTIEALAQKTDVKAQARRRLEDTKSKAEEMLGRAKEASPDSTSQAAAQVSSTARENPIPVAAGGAFLVGFLLGRLTKRR